MNMNIFGWLSLLAIAYAAILYLLNILNPNQEENRIHLHCNISKLTIPTIITHLLSQPKHKLSEQWVIWTGFGLYLIIIASGIVLLYLPDAGSLRYHARSIHSALFVGLAVSLIHHVLKCLTIF
jgi:hypothetical protein